MSLQLSNKLELQTGLSLKMWLPLLQSSLQELESHLQSYSNDNPFVEVRSSVETSEYYNQVSKQPYYAQNSDFAYKSSEFVEELATATKSLYEKLTDQIEPPLFPTPKSQKIALDIINYINEYGYFDGDIEEIAIANGVTNEFVQSVRQRFSYLEPIGVGALNLEESFLFQLSDFDLDEELTKFIKKLIENLSKIDKYATHHRFADAKEIIKKFKNPPAVEYIENDPQVIPDFFVNVGHTIEIKINSRVYPDVLIREPFSSKNDAIKEKLKEARNLVNMLQLRKATLYKIILMITEQQLAFFVGGELKPLTMQTLADELGFAESTISRAVANKYIECSRGIYSLKHFFTNSVSEDDLSSSEIKSFIKKLIEFENKDEPFTDEELLEKVTARFSIKMVRRSITKYRQLEDIPSSKERKKIYKIS